MIDLQEWLRQIVGYTSFVLDQQLIREAWISGDHSKTSVTNFDELFEQVFDDLASQKMVQRFQRELPEEGQKNRAVNAFLNALLTVDAELNRRPELKDASSLLASPHWAGVREAAKQVQTAFR